MATQAFVCRLRTDLPAGAVQITDLLPNTSQRNLVYQPVGQSGYCPPLYQDDTVTGNVAANVTTKALSGLAAWAADGIAVGGSGDGISAANADAIADAIFAKAQAMVAAGTDLNTAAVNAAISTVVAASGIGVGASLGTLVQVLRILAGEVYTVPSGTTVNPAVAYKGALAGAFVDAESEARGSRKIFLTGALQISCGAGVLNGLGSPSFSYSGIAGAAVGVFDSTGTLLNG